MSSQAWFRGSGLAALTPQPPRKGVGRQGFVTFSAVTKAPAAPTNWAGASCSSHLRKDPHHAHSRPGRNRRLGHLLDGADPRWPGSGCRQPRRRARLPAHQRRDGERRRRLRPVRRRVARRRRVRPDRRPRHRRVARVPGRHRPRRPAALRRQRRRRHHLRAQHHRRRRRRDRPHPLGRQPSGERHGPPRRGLRAQPRQRLDLRLHLRQVR